MDRPIGTLIAGSRWILNLTPFQSGNDNTPKANHCEVTDPFALSCESRLELEKTTSLDARRNDMPRDAVYHSTSMQFTNQGNRQMNVLVGTTSECLLVPFVSCFLQEPTDLICKTDLPSGSLGSLAQECTPSGKRARLVHRVKQTLSAEIIRFENSSDMMSAKVRTPEGIAFSC